MQKEKLFQLQEALDYNPLFIMELMRTPWTSAWKLFSLADSAVLGQTEHEEAVSLRPDLSMGLLAISHMDHWSK